VTSTTTIDVPVRDRFDRTVRRMTEDDHDRRGTCGGARVTGERVLTRTSSDDDDATAYAVARTLHNLYRALVDVGFTDAQALQLVAATVASTHADATEEQ
jgi:hypothetical protein